MHNNKGIFKILDLPKIYDLLQKIAGTNRVYEYIIDSKFENSKVLDIGCGTGTLANFLPKSVNYLGYDFNEKYIFEAKKHFAENGNIKFLLLNAYEKVELNQTFDFILISGLLHHLDDRGVENVFNVAKRHMNLESILISVDPTIYHGTSQFGKFLIGKDRGKAIRTKIQLNHLASGYFNNIEFEERNDFYRFPWSHLIMHAKL